MSNYLLPVCYKLLRPLLLAALSFAIDMRIARVAKPLYKYTDNKDLTKRKRVSDSNPFVFVKIVKCVYEDSISSEMRPDGRSHQKLMAQQNS